MFDQFSPDLCRDLTLPFKALRHSGRHAPIHMTFKERAEIVQKEGHDSKCALG